MESVWVTLFVCVACYAYNRKSVSFVSPKLIEDGLDRSHAGKLIFEIFLEFGMVNVKCNGEGGRDNSICLLCIHE